MQELHIMQIGDVLVSPDIITEYFCCDLSKCKGVCCIEGDAGAPVTLDEIGAMEDNLDAVWGELSASAQSISGKPGGADPDNVVCALSNGLTGKGVSSGASLSRVRSILSARRDLTWG